MSKNVEVEIRGPLTEDQATALAAAVASTLPPKGTFDRYMVDFTTDEMKKTRTDVRARVTNGKVEMIVKKGDFLSGARAEFPAQCKDGEFVPLVRALVAAGFTTGVGCHRVSKRFENDQMELAIISVPGHSIFYEAEMMVKDGDETTAQSTLEEWAKEKGLRVYKGDEFHRYVDVLDAEANDVLDFSNEESWTRLNERITNQSVSSLRRMEE